MCQARDCAGVSGDFANEVVDVCSKRASRGTHLGSIHFDQEVLWCRDGGRCLTWAGAVCRSLQGDKTLPPVFDQDLGNAQNLGGMSPAQILSPFEPFVGRNTPPRIQRVGTLHIRIASFNVLTLSDGKLKASYGSASTGLARQLPKPFTLAKCLDDADISADKLVESALEPKEWPLPADLKSIPSEGETSNALRATKVGKAPGGDGLPPGLGVAASASLAQNAATLAQVISPGHRTPGLQVWPLTSALQVWRPQRLCFTPWDPLGSHFGKGNA